MKLKSLILGSVAAAGLSTAGFAADLGVLTSLDVCDALGISGLTISSDTNCLQISGGVSYEFRWGDFRGATGIGRVPALATEAGLIDLYASNGVDPFELDWYSKVEAWLKFVGTASSDFGPASATIKIKEVEALRATNEAYAAWGDDEDLHIDEAYVSIGDSTVIMAGKKSSIANFGDAQPFNYLRTFGYTENDTGVLFQDDEDEPFTGGHVIQIVSDLGNGVSVSAGLENLEGGASFALDADLDGVNDYSKTAAQLAGTAVGVVAYAGEGITAHITGLAIGILDGDIDAWGVHAGATGTFDQFQVRGAVGYLTHDVDLAGTDYNSFHALLSAKGTFDMFTIAASGEYTRTDLDGLIENEGFGFGASVGATITEGVSINLGARYFSADLDPAYNYTDNDTLQVSAQLIAALTETIKVTAELGAYFSDDVLAPIDEDPLVYGGLELAWAPGGGFSSSIKGEANSQGGYRATFKAAKTFE